MAQCAKWMSQELSGLTTVIQGDKARDHSPNPTVLYVRFSTHPQCIITQARSKMQVTCTSNHP